MRCEGARDAHLRPARSNLASSYLLTSALTLSFMSETLDTVAR